MIKPPTPSLTPVPAAHITPAEGQFMASVRALDEDERRVLEFVLSSLGAKRSAARPSLRLVQGGQS